MRKLNKTFIPFFTKYRYRIPIILLLFFIVMMLFVVFHKPIIEGLATIGEYDFLGPIKDTDKITNETWKKFIQYKLKKQCTNQGSEELNKKCEDLNKENVKNNLGNGKTMFFNLVSDKELNYLINNDTYPPYGSYITNYINNNPTVGKIENLNKSASTRFIYNSLILPTEKVMNPQPESYNIFMGLAELTTSTTDTNSTTYYNDFITLCKLINSQPTTSSTTSKPYNDFVSLCNSSSYIQK